MLKQKITPHWPISVVCSDGGGAWLTPDLCASRSKVNFVSNEPIAFKYGKPLNIAGVMFLENAVIFITMIVKTNFLWE